MRIDTLRLVNFKGFQERELSFHPQFNLIVGENGSGKTSLLDALSVALGAWFLGLRGYDSRHIWLDEVRLEGVASNGNGRGRAEVTWERQFPCTVQATGEVLSKQVAWQRALESEKGRTTRGNAREIKTLATQADHAVRSGSGVVLPLISYYGTGRLWDFPRKQSQVKSGSPLQKKQETSRLEGYRNSVDRRLSPSDLVRWIAHQAWIAFQEGAESSVSIIVRKAITQCVEQATDVYFDARLSEVIVDKGAQGKQPFYNLSDGQRSMVALVGDLAQKAVKLNPQLGESALTGTPGVVLIDELDLHFHPKWQRHVIEDMRRVFPRVQFFATTHSPFLIQSLRLGEELVTLDGVPTPSVANRTLEEIARDIMEVPNPDVSQRYQEMKSNARRYLEELERAPITPGQKLLEFKERLAKAIAPYADNPAYQAFLEMKRAAKLGE